MDKNNTHTHAHAHIHRAQISTEYKHINAHVGDRQQLKKRTSRTKKENRGEALTREMMIVSRGGGGGGTGYARLAKGGAKAQHPS